MARRMQEKYPGLKIHTYCIRNDFFGERITVSGLITGQDLMAQLKDQELGERLLIPCNMLKMDEDIFWMILHWMRWRILYKFPSIL